MLIEKGFLSDTTLYVCYGIHVFGSHLSHKIQDLPLGAPRRIAYPVPLIMLLEKS